MKKCKIILFLVSIALEAADLISDWLFYVDVRVVKEGLVYGPPGDAPTNALLVFSIIGSVLFLVESVNLGLEMYSEKPSLDSNLVSAVVIWCEDLPQIAINVSIAVCREDPVNDFQLAKASMVLISLVIRIILCVLKYRYKETLGVDDEHPRRRKVYWGFIGVGLFVNSVCAGAVFFFTQHQFHKDDISFQEPDTINQRYFTNVSVFIHHPEFDQTTPSETTGFQANWIRLMSINDIRGQEDLDISYNYVFEKTPTHLLMALYRKEDQTGKNKQGKWDLSECYQMELQKRLITTVSNAQCRNSTFFSSQAISVFITFSFTPPATFFREHIFGDIRFNTKVFLSGSCSEFNFTDSVGNNILLPSIRYYRLNACLNASLNASLNTTQSRHLLLEPDGSGDNKRRFYRSDSGDLEDITTVWKTGWGRCESSGSKAPHLDRGIPVECSNTASVVTG